MKNLRLETSVRDASKAYEALHDTHMDEALCQTASNVWETPEYDEDESGEYPGDEYAEEQLEMLLDDIEDVMKRYGVEEYELEII